MWLPWQSAFEIAAVVVVVALVVRQLDRSWAAATVATLKETALVLCLYALWQYAHELAIDQTAGAEEHARWIWNFEQRWHFPSELSVQHLFIHHRIPMEFLNIYYAVAHVPAAGILLVWLFFRHRDRYSRIRTTFALTIAGCLVIQMIPVAPPRFLPDLGFVDSALLYHQSVYGAGGNGISNQLAAMPSHHVGWALLVGIAVVTISRSKWRWLVLLHTALTILAVTATANHWWLDGVVAGMVLAVAYAVVVAISWARAKVWPTANVQPADADEPLAVEAQLA